jgi:hypothetical protein
LANQPGHGPPPKRRNAAPRRSRYVPSSSSQGTYRTGNKQKLGKSREATYAAGGRDEDPYAWLGRHLKTTRYHGWYETPRQIDQSETTETWNALKAFKMTNNQTVEDVVIQIFKLFRLPIQ